MQPAAGGQRRPRRPAAEPSGGGAGGTPQGAGSGRMGRRCSPALELRGDLRKPSAPRAPAVPAASCRSSFKVHSAVCFRAPAS